MNENQLKTKIFLFKAIDTILVLTLLGMVGYTIFYVEERQLMIVNCLIGLAIVTTVGRFLGNKAALMKVQLDMLIRKNKTEEQRTLMSTRHSTLGGTKATTINSTATTKKD